MTPATAKTAQGQPISMEAFCIAVAKRLALPGFGDRAIGDGRAGCCRSTAPRIIICAPPPTWRLPARRRCRP
ncbi:hypothetical protein M8494_04780 [Serratia ureilytica]